MYSILLMQYPDGIQVAVVHVMICVGQVVVHIERRRLRHPISQSDVQRDIRKGLVCCRIRFIYRRIMLHKIAAGEKHTAHGDPI